MLTTDGSIACTRRDHLFYDYDMAGYDGDRRGLQVRLDNKNATCSDDAELSTGHLRSHEGFWFGDLVIEARVAHSPDDLPTPNNAMTCFSLYTNIPVHNEIALCFRATNSSTFSVGYWVGYDGDIEHSTSVFLPDTDSTYHNYSIAWREDYLAVFVDANQVVRFNGSAVVNGTLPWNPMSIRLILRPRDANCSDYEGDAYVNVVRLSYTPWSRQPRRTPA